MKTAISAILIMLGLVMMAGSGGDCDGKCMENANTLGEMMFWAFMGRVYNRRSNWNTKFWIKKRLTLIQSEYIIII